MYKSNNRYFKTNDEKVALLSKPENQNEYSSIFSENYSHRISNNKSAPLSDNLLPAQILQQLNLQINNHRQTKISLLAISNILPEVLLSNIFSYLSDTEIHISALVCRKWYKASLNPCLYNLLELSAYFYKIDDNFIENIVLSTPKYTHVKRILLDNCREVTDKGLILLAARCYLLEKISLKGCCKITTRGIISLLRLTAVDHIQCPRMSFEDIKKIVALFPHVNFGDIWKQHCAQRGLNTKLESLPHQRGYRLKNMKCSFRMNSKYTSNGCWGKILGTIIHNKLPVEQAIDSNKIYCEEIVYTCEQHEPKIEQNDDSVVLCVVCENFYHKSLVWQDSICKKCRDKQVLSLRKTWIDLSRPEELKIGSAELVKKICFLLDRGSLPETLKTVKIIPFNPKNDLNIIANKIKHSLCKSAETGFRRALIVYNGDTISVMVDPMIIRTRSNNSNLYALTFFMRNFYPVLLPTIVMILFGLLLPNLNGEYKYLLAANHNKPQNHSSLTFFFVFLFILAIPITKLIIYRIQNRILEILYYLYALNLVISLMIYTFITCMRLCGFGQIISLLISIASSSLGVYSLYTQRLPQEVSNFYLSLFFVSLSQSFYTLFGNWTLVFCFMLVFVLFWLSIRFGYETMLIIMPIFEDNIPMFFFRVNEKFIHPIDFFIYSLLAVVGFESSLGKYEIILSIISGVILHGVWPLYTKNCIPSMWTCFIVTVVWAAASLSQVYPVMKYGFMMV